MLEGGYHWIRNRLAERLDEPAPARVQVLTGPRQVGKTSILLDAARQWGEAAIYLAADAPEAALSGWWEAQWRRATEMARLRKTVLMLDEAQYLPNWSRLVKAASDQAHREQLALHFVVTGSAALQVGSGARETMAGRYERLVLRNWNAQDLSAAFSLTRQEAVERYVRFGAFPGAMSLLSDVPRWKAYLRDSIIDPAIGRDLLLLQPVRKPALLRQVFAVCAGHPSQVLSLTKIAGALTESGALDTIAHYLSLLEDAYLVSPLPKHSATELRRRASPPKVVPLSNAFLAASLPGEPPLAARDPAAWGVWLENACLAFAIGCEQTVHYWREEPLEVDAVLTGSWGKWAVEVKAGGYTSRDLSGLLEFCRRWPEYRPLVIGQGEHADTARRLGVEFRAWDEFLWSGLP